MTDNYKSLPKPLPIGKRVMNVGEENSLISQRIESNGISKWETTDYPPTNKENCVDNLKEDE